jgi:hypothetical protein
MNVEIGTETPIFLFWEYLFRNFVIFSLQCVSSVTLLGTDGTDQCLCCATFCTSTRADFQLYFAWCIAPRCQITTRNVRVWRIFMCHYFQYYLLKPLVTKLCSLSDSPNKISSPTCDLFVKRNKIKAMYSTVDWSLVNDYLCTVYNRFN